MYACCTIVTGDPERLTAIWILLYSFSASKRLGQQTCTNSPSSPKWSVMCRVGRY